MRRFPTHVTILVLAAIGSGCVKNGTFQDPGRTPTSGESILLRNLRVFDVSSGTMSAPQDILIEGDRITASGQHKRVAGSPLEVDCSGKYAVPGLFDCHVHLSLLTTEGEDHVRKVLSEFVAIGVTQVRDVGGPIDVLSRLSHRISSGETTGPELFYAGPMLEASPPTWEKQNKEHPGFTVAIDSTEDVDKVLPGLARQGACMVKTFNKFDRDVYSHLVAVARRHSLRIVHDTGMPLFHPVPIDVAMDMGVLSIEHAKAPLQVVLTDDLKQEHDRLVDREAHKLSRMLFMMKVYTLGIEAISQERLRRLADKMKERGAYLCPTLQAFSTIEDTSIDQMKEELGIEEVPDTMRSLIRNSIAAMELVSRAFVREFARAGVKLLVGQDGWDPMGTFAEMRCMKECGVTEAEIIKGATIYPAQWLGVDNRLGSISPGKQANILILHENPLDDIENIKSTFMVVQDGRIVSWADGVQADHHGVLEERDDGDASR